MCVPTFLSFRSTTMGRPVQGIALLSGFLGATASCFAKFAFSDSFASEWVGKQCLFVLPDGQACSFLQLLPRGVCLLAMIGCNVIMLGSFLEGMEESGSVAGTALATGANFAAASVYGYLLWDESFPPTWWLGFAMIVTGVMLLSTVKRKQD
jgi:multidrug transporter EmrE-like cation transporter